MRVKPAIKLQLGNLLYESHVTEVICTSAFLPEISRVQALLPSNVDIEAAIEDEGILTLDNGDGEEKILTGKVHSFHRGLFMNKITVTDGSADLNGFRPAVTYEKQNAKDIIGALASDTGVGVNAVDIDLPLAAYTAHQNRTAAEHIAYLSKLSGGFARTDSEGELQVSMWPEGSSDAVLTYGREVLDYTATDRSGGTGQPVMIGSGPAGSNEAPDALRHSAAPLPGNAPDPGSQAVWKPAAILRTPGAATGASEAAAREKAIHEHRFFAHCILSPSLKPGMVLEVQGLPDNLSGGAWVVTMVVHHVQSGSGGTTRLEGVTTGSGLDFSLASLLSAAGGLL